MTTTAFLDNLEASLRPALDKYGAALDAHGHDYDRGGCKCGRSGNRQSTGLHIAAAYKRAEREFDADAKTIRDEQAAARRAARDW